MLRYTCLLLLILGMASPASAQWATGLFDETSCDFGVVPGQVLIHPFRLVNRTQQTIHISSVSVSCGCTSAYALQKELAPGQETAVVAQMDAQRIDGFKQVIVYVRFDQPQFDEVRLLVQSTRRHDLTYAPEGLHYGKVKQGAAVTTQMTVSINCPTPTKIIGIESKSAYVTPTFKELHRAPGEAIYQISATLRPDTPDGRWFTDVWLTTNNPEMLRLRLPLTVEVEPSPVAKPAVPAPTTPAGDPASKTTSSSPTPPKPTAPPAAPPNPPPPPSPAATPQGAVNRATPNIALGDVKAGIDSERKVILRSSQPFRITSIQGADNELLVQPVSNDSKTVHVLTVTIRSNQPGQLIRMIRVRTDLETQREIEFNAQAKIVP